MEPEFYLRDEQKGEKSKEERILRTIYRSESEQVVLLQESDLHEKRA
jgi:hypothetical protein